MIIQFKYKLNIIIGYQIILNNVLLQLCHYLQINT